MTPRTVSPACNTQEQSDCKEREKPLAAMRASLKAVSTRWFQAFIPASLGASSGQVGPVCLVQRDQALSVMKGEGRERRRAASQASSPQQTLLRDANQQVT